ncbi:MAG: hypothetical protein M3403_07890, partial [Gemmatimonadota bacterium]|nr:hypothetical protein [Gemmatimonadota bacterium]
MNDRLVPAGGDTRLGLAERVFAWSLIFESLLFFVLGSQFATGFNITIGKALQLFLMAWLLLGRIAYGRDIWVPNPRSPQFRYFAAFLVLAIVSGIAGALGGAYVLQNQYFSAYASNVVARIIRGAGTRPFIEYGILLYYFLYFAVLPGYLLKTEAAKAYFFKYFRFAFILCLT